MASIGKPLSNVTRDNEQNKFSECNGDVVIKTIVCQETGETIKVEFQQEGETKSMYAESNSVSALGTVDVLTYIVPISKEFILSHCDFSGDNRGVFELLIDTNTFQKRRTSYLNYNDNFLVEDIIIVAGQEIKIRVENKSDMIGNFNVTIQGKLRDA